MTVALNVYRAVTAYNEAESQAQFIKTNPKLWQIYSNVIIMRHEAEKHDGK